MAEDIRVWLEGLGLDEYSDAFIDNAIDRELLPHLTNEDLKELGITKLGDRKKLLLNLEQLSSIKEIPSNEVGSAKVLSADGAEAVRRQLTVMFCDLAG